MTLDNAYRLACFIQWEHAKELALESRRYRRGPDVYYDPLAMVCLAELIYNVGNSKKGFYPYVKRRKR